MAMVAVASVCSTEAVATVYNLRVADHHTYFVGGTIWGWDVWVHNAGYVPDPVDVSAYVTQRQSGNGVNWNTINATLTGSQRSTIRRIARSQGLSIPTPNPHGAPGNSVHQATVSRLVDLAKAEHPGAVIHQGTSIKRLTGLSRNPDVWVENQGQVIKVYEAARKRAGIWVPREQDKLNDYNRLGIPSHFEEVI